MSFVQRQITITIQVGKGHFGEDGFDTYTLDGYRMSAHVERAPAPNLNVANVRVYGMAPSLMNAVSTLGGDPTISGRLNILTIAAGDVGGTMSQIFTGCILNGYIDYSGQPEVCFVADAASGALDLLKPAIPTSYPNDADVATILQSLAARMTPPLSFQNSGVSIKLSTPYFYGTLMDQIRSVVQGANINGEINNATLYIWPRNGARPGAATIDVSPETGLVGYPSFLGYQDLEVKMLFKPTLDVGAWIHLTSSLQGATGTWYIANLAHDVESITPGGQWFTTAKVWSKSFQVAQPAY